MLQQLEHNARDRDLHGLERRLRLGRGGERNGRAARDVESRLWARLKNPTVLQQAIGLERGRYADPALRANLAQ